LWEKLKINGKYKNEVFKPNKTTKMDQKNEGSQELGQKLPDERVLGADSTRTDHFLVSSVQRLQQNQKISGLKVKVLSVNYVTQELFNGNLFFLEIYVSMSYRRRRRRVYLTRIKLVSVIFNC
jgi:hypothetical protein